MNGISSEIEASTLHDWVDAETRYIDVVASWESLCETYRVLEFTDPLSDTVKLEEFKWIIKQMNAFLARQRKKLLTCQDIPSMQDSLRKSFTPEGKVNIDGRRALAYQKLRQRWIVQMLAELEQMKEQEEDSDNGWTDNAGE